jgi:hypothetical protein
MRHLLALLIAFATIACAGCAPVPQRLYVADAPDGELVYASCPLNKHVPVGVAFERDGVHLQVSLSKYAGRDYVEVRFDIPDGRTIVLQSGTVQVRRDASSLAQESVFPNVSLVDTPIVNSYSGGPLAEQWRLPIDAPLVGARFVDGPLTWDKHFWLATYVATASADDVWVSLPAFTINGRPANLAPIHFRSKRVIIIALINC